MSDQRPTVVVFGHSRIDPDGPAWHSAHDLGREIARAGWTLCNGGYGGTMEAAARGACEAGGHTIGVTCSALPIRGGPNAYIREEQTTGDLFARVRRLVELGHAYIALPGGTGTLLELALVWELVNKGLLGRGAPLVLLGDFWAGLNDLIRQQQPQAMVLPVAHTPQQAIELVRAGLAGGAAGGSTPRWLRE